MPTQLGRLNLQADLPDGSSQGTFSHESSKVGEKFHSCLLDVNCFASYNLVEAHFRAVKSGESCGDVVLAGLLGDELVELATCEGARLVGELLARRHVVQRTVDVVAEFRPVRGAGYEHRFLAPEVLRHAVGHGRMRVHQVMVLVEGLADGLKALFVGNGICDEGLADLGEGVFVHLEAALLVQIAHPAGDGPGVAPRELEQLALEVGGDEDVHRGGGRQHELALGYVVGTRVDEVGQHAVLVARAHEHVDGGSHAFGVPGGQDVAEVAGRNADVDGVACVYLALGDQLAVAGEVVDDLREQAPPVDGVRA